MTWPSPLEDLSWHGLLRVRKLLQGCTSSMPGVLDPFAVRWQGVRSLRPAHTLFLLSRRPEPFPRWWYRAFLHVPRQSLPGLFLFALLILLFSLPLPSGIVGVRSDVREPYCLHICVF